MTFRHKQKPHKESTPEEQKVAIRAFIATPAYDGRVLTDYAISMAETCLVAGAMRIHITASIMGNGAFIDLARNGFVQMFLDTDCTHLFFIDADLRWEARAFISLLAADLPVCAGVYPKRQEPEEYPATFAVDKDTGGVWVTKNGHEDDEKTDNGWIMCERVPTGFLCIRRDVVEAMAKAAPVQQMKGHKPQPILFSATSFVRKDKYYAPIDLINGDFTPETFVDFLGEDFYFCDRYRKQFGKPIPVWPDFDFTHDKKWKGNWHRFLVKQGAEETEKINASETS